MRYSSRRQQSSRARVSRKKVTKCVKIFKETKKLELGKSRLPAARLANTDSASVFFLPPPPTCSRAPPFVTVFPRIFFFFFKFSELLSMRPRRLPRKPVNEVLTRRSAKEERGAASAPVYQWI